MDNGVKGIVWASQEPIKRKKNFFGLRSFFISRSISIFGHFSRRQGLRLIQVGDFDPGIFFKRLDRVAAIERSEDLRDARFKAFGCVDGLGKVDGRLNLL